MKILAWVIACAVAAFECFVMILVIVALSPFMIADWATKKTSGDQP